MRVQLFDNPDYLPARAEAHDPRFANEHQLDNELPQQLNAFVDAIAYGKNAPPYAAALGGINNARAFSDKVVEYTDKTYAQLLARKESSPDLPDSPTDEEKQQFAMKNQQNDFKLHNALTTYYVRLRLIYGALERLTISNKIHTKLADGTVQEKLDPEIQKAVRTDALHALESKMTAVASQIGVTDLHCELEAEALAKVRAELSAGESDKAAPQTGISNVTGSEPAADNKWSGGKILGVTALTVSVLGILVLAAYVYEKHKHARRNAQQSQGYGQPQLRQQSYGSQLPQTGGFGGYNTSGLVQPPLVQPAPAPALQPNLNAFGYTPGAPVPGMNMAQPAPSFDPNPIYGYPSQ